MTYSSRKLQELYQLLQKIDVAILGNDWQSKKLLRELRHKVVAEIKEIIRKQENMDMVK
jgi:hypothetical protein